MASNVITSRPPVKVSHVVWLQGMALMTLVALLQPTVHAVFRAEPPHIAPKETDVLSLHCAPELSDQILAVQIKKISSSTSIGRGHRSRRAVGSTLFRATLTSGDSIGIIPDIQRFKGEGKVEHPAYLKVMMARPDEDDAGQYECDVTTMGSNGVEVKKESLTIRSGNVLDLESLDRRVVNLEHQIPAMSVIGQSMEKIVEQDREKNSALALDVESLKKENKDLVQSVEELMKKFQELSERTLALMEEQKLQMIQLKKSHAKLQQQQHEEQEEDESEQQPQQQEQQQQPQQPQGPYPQQQQNPYPQQQQNPYPQQPQNPYPQQPQNPYPQQPQNPYPQQPQRPYPQQPQRPYPQPSYGNPAARQQPSQDSNALGSSNSQQDKTSTENARLEESDDVKDQNGGQAKQRPGYYGNNNNNNNNNNNGFGGSGNLNNPYNPNGFYGNPYNYNNNNNYNNGYNNNYNNNNNRDPFNQYPAIPYNGGGWNQGGNGPPQYDNYPYNNNNNNNRPGPMQPNAYGNGYQQGNNMPQQLPHLKSDDLYRIKSRMDDLENVRLTAVERQLSELRLQWVEPMSARVVDLENQMNGTIKPMIDKMVDLADFDDVQSRVFRLEGKVIPQMVGNVTDLQKHMVTLHRAMDLIKGLENASDDEIAKVLKEVANANATVKESKEEKEEVVVEEEEEEEEGEEGEEEKEGEGKEEKEDEIEPKTNATTTSTTGSDEKVKVEQDATTTENDDTTVPSSSTTRGITVVVDVETTVGTRATPTSKTTKIETSGPSGPSRQCFTCGNNETRDSCTRMTNADKGACLPGQNFCMTTVSQDGRLRYVYKRCATLKDCQIVHQSDEKCASTSFMKLTPMTCHFCCSSELCNNSLRPPKDLYEGK